MRPHRALARINARRWIGPLILAFAAPAVAQVTITPPSFDIELQPGDVAQNAVVVSVPGSTPPVPIDIYFLADTTKSMDPVLGELKNNIAGLLGELKNELGDVQFGAGEYRDFPLDEKGDFAFLNDLPVTADINDVHAAVLNWIGGGGPGDVPEAQLYALDQIADPSDPYEIGWRENAYRLIVWIGDGPGHDPVCANISGEEDDITEASVIDRLNARGITVLAIGTTTGAPNALNGDPTVNANDYLAACGMIGGSPGQADRIAAATDGLSVQDIDPASIGDTIQMLIAQATNAVDVNLVVKGDLAGRAIVMTPEQEDLALPPPGDQLDLVFIVQFVGLPCDPEVEPDVFVGSLSATVNGVEAATADTVIRQPICEPVAVPLRPAALDQVEVISCDVPYEFVFHCKSPDGLPVVASAFGDPASQPGFVGDIVIDGRTGSYTPPPNTNGLFFLDYVCDDGERTSNVAKVALWVLTCEADGGPLTPGQPTPGDATPPPDSTPDTNNNGTTDCSMALGSIIATFTGLCLVSGIRRRRPRIPR